MRKLRNFVGTIDFQKMRPLSGPVLVNMTKIRLHISVIYAASFGFSASWQHWLLTAPMGSNSLRSFGSPAVFNYFVIIL
jgi:hypothetical protein